MYEMNPGLGLSIQEILDQIKFKSLKIPAAVSEYPEIGAKYWYKEYPLYFSEHLIRTGKDLHSSHKMLPPGYRMTTAAEECAIQHYLEERGQDPRKSRVFADMFGENDKKLLAWQWTSTGLKMSEDITEPPEPEYMGQDEQKLSKMILMIDDKEIGPVLVPEGNGRTVVRAFDPVTGLPRITTHEKTELEYKNHTTHFYFKNPGEGIVPVWRRSCIHSGNRCLLISADMSRWSDDVDFSFRPVLASTQAKIESNYSITIPA